MINSSISENRSLVEIEAKIEEIENEVIPDLLAIVKYVKLHIVALKKNRSETDARESELSTRTESI